MFGGALVFASLQIKVKYMFLLTCFTYISFKVCRMLYSTLSKDFFFNQSFMRPKPNLVFSLSESFSLKLVSKIQALIFLSEMWWLIGSAPDFWGRGPGFESGTSHNDSDALQDHCEIMQKVSGQRGTPITEEKNIFTKQYT